MTPVYLCDDDIAWLDRIQAAVARYQVASDWDFSIACCTASPDTLLSHIRTDTPYCGVYFLDVELKAPVNGMELGTEIRKLDASPFLIYITIHEDMMRESFRRRLMALDFIIKDQGCPEEQLASCMRHIEEELAGQSPARVRLRINGSLTNIAIADILYAKSVRNMHKVTICTRTGFLYAPVTLTTLQKELGSNFIACDKNCIVGISHISSLNPKAKELILENGEHCRCSVRQWQKIVKELKLQDALLH